MGKFDKWHGIDRKKIPWYPTIRTDKCISCKLCFVTCGRLVFDWDDVANKPIVARPFGPRPPGSAVHDSFMVWLKNFLDTLADSTEIQYFSAVGYDGEILRMGNIIARFNPGAKEKSCFAHIGILVPGQTVTLTPQTIKSRYSVPTMEPRELLSYFILHS